MSNKTQLQTNNTNLDTLITRVNAAKDVAASLPEAGGTGGEDNVEVVDVDILVNLPEVTVYYVNESKELQEVTGGMMTPISALKVKKNSILVISSSVHATSEDTTIALNGYTIVFVTSDAPQLTAF